MPIYDGSLHDLIWQYRPRGLRAMMHITRRMLSQISDALDYVHSRVQPVIHRDIKPANILYRGDKFFLTDFGIAKVIDTSSTCVGTMWYAAPEVCYNREQTPKVDIYSLGVTVVECLVGLPTKERPRTWGVRDWFQALQALMAQHAPRCASMLEEDPYARPTARELLNHFSFQPTHAPLRNPQTSTTWASLGVSPSTDEPNEATVMYQAPPTAMDWTRTVATAIVQGVSQPTQQNGDTQPPQPNPGLVQSPNTPSNRPVQPRARGGSVKSSSSAGQRQRRSHSRHGSSQSGPSRPGRAPKRTLRRRGRPKSRSISNAGDSRA